jgi:hypothetical protein
VEVGSSDVDGVAVQFEPGLTLNGVVRVESQSQQNGPPPQIPLNFTPAEGAIGPGGQLKWSDDHQSFTISGLLPGAYRLDTFPLGRYYIKSARLGAQDLLQGDVQVSPGAGTIEILLRDDTGSLEGDVVDSSGQPVSAGILLLRKDGRPVNAMAPPGGHFKLQSVAPGDYTAYAWDKVNEVQYADTDWMRRYAGSGVAVTIQPGQNAQVKLTQQTVPQ